MKRGETFLPDDFLLTQATLAWTAEKFPAVDVPETLDVFRDKALARGWIYRDWQAAWRNYCRNGAQYGGLVYRQGRAADPRWAPALAEAAPYGFREPLPHETPAGYTSAFRAWKDAQKRAPAALDVRGVIRTIDRGAR